MSMTVSDLMNALSKCDPGALVFSGVAYDGDTSFTHVSSIAVSNAHLIETSFFGEFYEPTDDPDDEPIQAVFING